MVAVTVRVGTQQTPDNCRTVNYMRHSFDAELNCKGCGVTWDYHQYHPRECQKLFMGVGGRKQSVVVKAENWRYVG